MYFYMNVYRIYLPKLNNTHKYNKNILQVTSASAASAFCFSNCNGSLNMHPADQSDLIPVSHFLK